MSNQLISFLQLYKPIPEADQELISTEFEYKTFPEGSYLFEGMKVCTELFFICDGILRISLQQKEGRELTRYLLTQNQFCTLLNSFNHEVPAPEQIQAVCNVQVLVISKKNLMKLYQQLPYLKALIDEIIQELLMEKNQIRNAYLEMEPSLRYEEFINDQPDIALRVPLNDVASYLGVSPQLINRIRKQVDEQHLDEGIEF
ncbi:Crp/Fnr family transcriptional regulator [Pedobacter caeni]|uniref:cAMP-binding domain of CRP or a regulatory subunit of cAMP-dependent protein kinases n=1 Tax=Pedobacter caeni TaxID=288992 RepID=A0A1M5ARZ0_9SPHI|nr:cyclic nucleotide-binding domain-containing protein [Pedobacter caeni]SHF33000.1 cAMP-binding domain of CRP or a regulatory subunit of cAMP-dependent protein kinases [Pedobacter caeni]